MEHARAAPVYHVFAPSPVYVSIWRVRYRTFEPLLRTTDVRYCVHRTLTDRSADENGGVGRHDMTTFYANMSSAWPSSAPGHASIFDNGARAQQSPSRPSFKPILGLPNMRGGVFC